MANLINRRKDKKQTSIIFGIVFALLGIGLWGFTTQPEYTKPVPTEVEITHLFSSCNGDYSAFFYPVNNPEVVFKGELTKKEFDSLNPGSRIKRELSPMSVEGYGYWRMIGDIFAGLFGLVAIIFLSIGLFSNR